MKRALAGFHVWVTRPGDRATLLAREVVTAGGTPLTIPAIAIEGIPDPDCQSALAGLGRCQILVFTSEAAVTHALDRARPAADAALWAVGPATLQALERRGFEARCPAGRSNSEGLLAALPDVTGVRVGIVAAPGGRQLLAESLARRGAEVMPLHVYRRVPVNPDPQDAAALARHWPHCLVTATSIQILNQVHHVCRTESLTVSGQPLAALSPRIGEQARELGFDPVTVAEPVSDAGLIQALQRLVPAVRMQ